MELRVQKVLMKLPRTPGPNVRGSSCLPVPSSEMLVLFAEMLIHDFGLFHLRCSEGVTGCGVGFFLLLLLRDGCVMFERNSLTRFGSTLTRSIRIDGRDTQRKPAASSSSVHTVIGT